MAGMCKMSGMDRLTELFDWIKLHKASVLDGMSRREQCEFTDAFGEALLAHRRASQAAPAPQDADRTMLIKELSDAARWRRLPDNENQLATAVLFERAVAALSASPDPSDGLREENERLRAELDWIGNHMVMSMALNKSDLIRAMKARARAAMTTAPAQEGEPRHD